MTDVTDLSASQPMVKWSEQWWAAAKRETQARRCKAHRKNGDRCKRLSLVGQRVCSHHGGKAKQSLLAARQRLMENADPAVKQLAEIAYDDKQSAEIRLKATLALIDRAGLTPKTALEIEIGPPKPYETIFESIEMEGGSRAAFRGEPQRALDASDADLIVDAEIEDDDDGLGDDLVVDGEVVDPMTPDDRERGSVFDLGPNPFTRTPPLEAQMMPFDAAVSAAAQMRRNAVSRPAQRALPRGRT
jgi:hypothetical protein